MGVANCVIYRVSISVIMPISSSIPGYRSIKKDPQPNKWREFQDKVRAFCADPAPMSHTPLSGIFKEKARGLLIFVRRKCNK
jgi:hypothetical protein